MKIDWQKISRPSVISLILANLMPLFGVLLFDWKLFPIMFLYWLESAIVGFYNVLKMIKAEGTAAVNIELNERPIEQWSKLAVIFFFMFHYGIFMLVHGVFIFVLFGPADMSLFAVFVAFPFLFISHGLSFIFNFLKQGEYKEISLGQQMMQPYLRIIIMHLTILIGGFTAKFLGAPPTALVIMILLKIMLDLYAHMKEHKMLGSFGLGVGS